MLFIFSMKIRVFLQKVNEMTLEICSYPFWTRIVICSMHVNMNSIAFAKFEDTLRADMFIFVTTSTMIVKIMMNFLRSIDINIHIAIALTIYRWSCIKWINSVVWASEFSIWCIESRTNIVFNILPNNLLFFW